MASIASQSAAHAERLIGLGAVRALLVLAGHRHHVDVQRQAGNALTVLSNASAEVKADLQVTVGSELLTRVLSAPEQLTATQCTLLSHLK